MTRKSLKTLLGRLTEEEPHLCDVIDMCGTRDQAADIAGVKRRTVHNWLTGKSQPSFFQGIALCRAAGVDPLIVHDDSTEDLTFRLSPPSEHKSRDDNAD